MSHRNLRILLPAIIVCYCCYVRADRSPASRQLTSALGLIEDYALKEIPSQQLLASAINGMIAKLELEGDLHSAYIPPRDSGGFYAEINQRFGGIGVLISRRGDPPMPMVVCPPEPGTPAAGKLGSGDVILAVSGKLTAGLGMNDILRIMRGPIGKPVQLTVRAPASEDPREVTVERALIETDSVRGRYKDDQANWIYRMPAHPGIAHVRVTSFAPQTFERLHEVIEALQADKQGLKGLVLDLRENSGGDLAAAVKTCDLFLSKDQEVVLIRDRQGDRKRYIATGDGPFQNLPLIVLINRESASASEIVAGALQDHDRAVVMGERSFGKGTVQRLFPLGSPDREDETSQGGQLKLTTDSFHRPNRRNIQRQQQKWIADDEHEWGILPDAEFNYTIDAKEHTCFQIQRRNDDTFNPAGDALLLTSDDVNGQVALKPGDLEDFQDRVLAAAEKYLSENF